jgi:biotin carboxylase
MTTKARSVLQLGAGRLMCHSIRKLQQIGFRTLAVDQDVNAPGFALVEDHAPIDVRDTGSVVRYASSKGVDLILAVNEPGVLTAAEASQQLGLPNIPPDVARRCLHKGLMREAWQRAGLPQPVFTIVRSADAIADAANSIGYPVILKPARNWGSRGVSRVAEPSDLSWSIEFASTNCPDGDFIVEQCLFGTEMTIEGLVKCGQLQVLAQSDKEPQQHSRYRVAMALNYPARFAQWQLDRATEVVTKAAQALGIENGSFHCECMVTETEVFLLEMAVRPGGGHIFGQIVEASSGVCMPQILVRLLLGEDPDIRPRYQRGACYKFFSPPPGVFQRATGVEEARQLPGILDFGFHMRPGTSVSSIAGDADRPGYAVATAETRDEAIENANRAIASVKYIVG